MSMVGSSGGMLANDNEISLYTGDSADFILTVTDDDGDIVKLTGATIAFTVKDRVGGTIFIRKTTADSLEIEITEPLAGKAKIKLQGSDTQELDCKAYVYDVRVELADGFRATVIPPTPFRVKHAVGSY